MNLINAGVLTEKELEVIIDALYYYYDEDGPFKVESDLIAHRLHDYFSRLIDEAKQVRILERLRSKNFDEYLAQRLDLDEMREIDRESLEEYIRFMNGEGVN